MANEKRLIDANALIDNLELLAKHEDVFRQSVILGVVHTIRNRPTVDAVEVVHGRWLTVTDKDEDWGDLDYPQCSVCGSVRMIHTNYCPNCGAKMDGDGNG